MIETLNNEPFYICQLCEGKNSFGSVSCQTCGLDPIEAFDVMLEMDSDLARFPLQSELPEDDTSMWEDYWEKKAILGG